MLFERFQRSPRLALCLTVISWTALNAEEAAFKAGAHATAGKARGVTAVTLNHRQATATAQLTLKAPSEGALWLRVLFPWVRNQKLRVTLDARPPVVITGLNNATHLTEQEQIQQANLWNSGNIDVWHWVRVWRGRLGAGQHTVLLDATAGTGASAATAVWTESAEPWREDWLFGPKVAGAIRGAQAPAVQPLPQGASLIIEAEKGFGLATATDGKAVHLEDDDAFLAVPFVLTTPFSGTLWFRRFIYAKSNYEGFTLDELSNATCVFLDGELKYTDWGEDGYHYRWYRIDDVSLPAGRHLLGFKKRGATAVIDKFVLYSGADFRKQPWFSVGPALEPAVQPFFLNAGYPEYPRPLKIVGRLATGFGVPGDGFPEFLTPDLLLLPGGEGSITVVNVSDPRKPTLHGFGLNWYFNHNVFPCGKGFYTNSSHRGVYYVEGAIERPERMRFRLVDLAVARFGRLGAIFPDAKPFPIAVTFGGPEGAAILDVSQPLYPRFVGGVKGYVGRGYSLAQDGRSAAVIAADGRFGVIDFFDPLRASCRPIFAVAAAGRQRGPSAPRPGAKGRARTELARFAGMSSNWIFLRLGTKLHLYRRTGAFGAAPAGEIDLGKRPGRAIRAYEHGGLIHVMDGVGGSGQYGIGYNTPHSRWSVYKPADLSKPIYVYTDPYPTAYSMATFRGDKAYVFDYNYGLWIFDLTRPEQPVKLGGISTAGEGHSLHVLDNHVACMAQTFGGTITAIDVSDPARPKWRGQFWDGSWFAYDNVSHTDLMTGKGTIIYFPKRIKGLQMIDFKQPDAPVSIGYVEGGKCRVVGDRLYTFTGKDLLVYDVTDERKPVLLGKLDAGIRAMSMAVDPPRTVWLTDFSRVVAIGVADPRKLEVVGRLDPQDKNRKFWGGIFFHKGYVSGPYGTRRSGPEFVTIDARDPAKMKWLTARVWQPRGLQSDLNDTWANFYSGDLFMHGNYIFLSNYARIEVYDGSDPLNVKPVQLINTGFQWTGGKIKFGHLYVPTLSGLVVIELP